MQFLIERPAKFSPTIQSTSTENVKTFETGFPVHLHAGTGEDQLEIHYLNGLDLAVVVKGKNLNAFA